MSMEVIGTRKEKNQVPEERNPDTVQPGEDRIPGPGQRLHTRIPQRDPAAAPVAPSPKKEKTQEGDVLPRGDGPSAGRAARTGAHDRLTPGKPTSFFQLNFSRFGRR